MGKITKLLGIIFAVLTLLSLTAPLYKTNFTDGESMTLLLHGFDLYEFSAWGVVTALIPLLLIGIMFTKFSDKIKSALIMGCPWKHQSTPRKHSHARLDLWRSG